MLEFGSSLDSDLANFQFDPNPNEPDMSMPAHTPNMVPMNKSLDPRKVRSREDLSLNTRFSQMNTNYDHLSAINPFSPVVMSSTSVGVEPSTAYVTPNMDMAMDFDPMTGTANPTTMQSRPMQEAMFSASPIDQSYSIPYQAASHDPGGGSISPRVHGQMSTVTQPMTFPNPPQQMRRHTPISTSVSMAACPASSMASPVSVHNPPQTKLSMGMQASYPSNGKGIGPRLTN